MSAGALAARVGAPSARATPTPRLVVDAPPKRTLIREGQAGRLLMGGAWYFRLDDARTGRFQRQRSLRGWIARVGARTTGTPRTRR